MPDLKREVETALGFELSTFERIKAGSSPNYRAERKSDGLKFLIKLLPPNRRYTFPVVTAHLEELAGTKCCQRMFAEAAEMVGECKMLCLEWCEGKHKLPHQLTDDEIKWFADDYVRISEALQKCSHVYQADNFLKWYERLMACRGQCFGRLQRFAKREVPVASITPKPELLRVVYGDFHHGNLVFEKGRISRFFDVESFSYGYPTEDIVRYFTCAIEHLPLGGIGYRAKTLDAFEKMVNALPYSREEWMYAVNGFILRKFVGLEDGECTFFKSVNLISRAKFYLEMRRRIP